MGCRPSRWPGRWATPVPRPSITTSIEPSRRCVRAWNARGSREETCEPRSSRIPRVVRTTWPMPKTMLRSGPVTHPAPELLVPYALGAAAPPIARHVEHCATCQAEVKRLREAAGALRAPASLEHRRETPTCLDDLAIADFVEGRLGPEARAPVVAHLLTCARCRGAVKDTAAAAAAAAAQAPRWRRWSVPLGLAAAAA